LWKSELPRGGRVARKETVKLIVVVWKIGDSLAMLETFADPCKANSRKEELIARAVMMGECHDVRLSSLEYELDTTPRSQW